MDLKKQERPFPKNSQEKNADSCLSHERPLPPIKTWGAKMSFLKGKTLCLMIEPLGVDYLQKETSSLGRARTISGVKT